MPITLPDLTTLDPDLVAQAQALLTQTLAEAVPDVDVRTGAVRDIVLGLTAVVQTGLDVAADNIVASSSLVEVTANPTLADETTVDKILSNYSATRVPGAPATGQVVIVVSSNAPSNAPAGAGFSAGTAFRFVTQQAFAGRQSASQVTTSTDRLMRSVGNGQFAYTIDVVADQDGPAGVKRLTQLVPDVPIANFVLAYAESDFTGGADPETNEALVERLKDGLAAKDLSNADTISALIRTDSAFSQTTAVSVIGYGAPEQHRHHGLFPGSGGARIDVYVRTAPLPAVLAVTKSAVVVSTGPDGSTWQIGIGKDDAPGYYDVDRILSVTADPSSDTGFAPINETRSFDITGEGFQPDIVTPEEAAYSPVQSGTVQFVDSTSTDPIGTQKDYVIYLRAMPQLSDLQTLLGGPDVRPTGGDVLVRAPVPCDVQAAVTLHVPHTTTTPDTSAVKTAVANAVNAIGFTGLMPASTVTLAANTILIQTQSVGLVELFGKIRRPDGEFIYLDSPVGLEVTDDPENGVTANTVCFFLDPSDVDVVIDVR